MADEDWTRVAFGDCASLVHESVDPTDMPGVPYIGLEHIGEQSLSLVGHGYSDDVSSTKTLFGKGDILFGKLRPYFRKVIIAPFDGMCSTDIWVVRPKANIDARYLFYWMASRDFVDASTRGSEGTKMPRAQWEFVSRFERVVPPLETQQAIAGILGSLDDKIELNRRMNQTLEGMARAIFKSWFVDFDPVRAKAAGRQPSGLASHIADLFPDAFEEPALGEIPKGWRLTSLGEQATVVKGLSYKGKHLCDVGEGLPLHNLNSVYEGGGYKYEGIKWYNGEYRERHLLAPGDVIVTNTEQGFDHLLIGYAAIVPKHFGQKGLFSHHIYRLRPQKDSYLPPWFFHLLLRTPRFHQLVAGYSNGTTVNMLPADGLQKPQFILPPKALVEQFDNLFVPIASRIEVLYDENCSLVETRDALLPKLISGELRVADAERIVGRCV